jgi:hypothetical protein
VVGRGGIEPLAPAKQIPRDLRRVATKQHASRLLARPAVRRTEQFEKFRQAGARDLRRSEQRPILGRDPPDSPARLVAIRMPEAHLIVPDDRIEPVGDIKRAVGPELHVHRSKRAMPALNDRRQRGVIGDLHAGAVALDLERPDAVVDEPAREHQALPLGGEVRALDDFGIGRLAAALFQPNRVAPPALPAPDHLRRGKVEATGVARDDDRLAPAGKDPAPRVQRLVVAPVERVESLLARTIPPQARVIERGDAPRRLDPREAMQPLAEHQFARRAPAKRIYVLVIVARAEAAQHDLASVGAAVAIRVRHQPHLRPLTDIARVAGTRRDLKPHGNHEAIGEHRGLVRAPVAVGVLENDDLVVGFLAGFDLRIDL